ncbi:hypothetical protein KP001_03220 [Geomonas subterranea]|uniref:Uncharacterized protein n=1 Tax=Geomonas subterranea TaxID=2847989 RepID=A0ABX8LJP5_9BACT|nr:DUF6178 family protein [Geomonas subterranea]QXE91571.1 hypothetical protein KP001_03220 [Geomonas subterranea]QXM10340.1 hypothetical protein KP002_04275 [Geomonas subterranea]
MAEKNQVATVKLSERDFQALPLQQKNDYLRTVSGKEKLDLIVGDADAKRLAAALPPQELFWLMKEVGEADAVDLLRIASAEQAVFIMDMELWDGWTFSEEQACHWLTYFMEGGEARVHELLKHLDYELLQLLLSREIVVGGGIGDQGNDEERQGDYDHTFDDVFMIKFKNPKHSQLIGAFLSMLVKLDNELYTALMEGVKGDVDLELEEQCQRFRTGRLQDLGFPPLEEALSIYARIHPDHFQLQGGKEFAAAAEGGQLMPVFAGEGTLLERALGLAGSDILMQELNYLVNSALVAEGEAFHEPESMLGVMHRVCGYLNIALERLAAGDERKAAQILAEEELKRLFQLGYSIVLQLKFVARDTETVDYATGKLLAGLKAKRPRFYRGLDADGVDGYREFRDLDDVRRVSDLLAQLQGQ